MVEQNKNYVINEFKNGESYYNHYYVDSEETAWEIIREVAPNIPKTPNKKCRNYNISVDPNDKEIMVIDDGKNLEYWYFINEEKDSNSDRDLTYTVIHYIWD